MIRRRRTAARSSAGLDRILDELVVRVGEVRHAVVFSRDGVTISASCGLSRREAEHLSAVACGFHSLAERAGRRARTGPARRTVIEMAGGRLFVATAGDGTCLAVLSTSGADPAVVAAETSGLVERLDQRLRRRPRPLGRSSAVG